MKISRAFNSPQKLAWWVIVIIVLISVVFLTLNRLTPNTDDALVNAFVIKVATIDKGKIAHMYVVNNQYVKAGQPLFAVDQKPYRIALAQAKTAASVAKKQYQQMQLLLKRGAISLDRYLQIKSLYASAEKALEEAQYQYDHVVVKAPTNGYVSNLRVNQGSYAAAGQAILSFVSDTKWWVSANFKENNLSRIKPGQTVWVSLSMYPGDIVKAKVTSIDWGVAIPTSNSEGALPKIAKTNNWIRLAQRFPVRITMPHRFHGKPYRIGATAIVTVVTTGSGFVKGLAYANQWFRAELQRFY